MNTDMLPSGLFIPGHSVLHKMDPLIKLLDFLILTAAAVLTDSLPGYGVWILFLTVLCRLSGVGAGTVFSGVLRLKGFFLLIFLMNTCFYGTDSPWVAVWIFRPSAEGLMQGLTVTARTIIVMTLSNILTTVTAPVSMTEALAALLKPFGFLGMPVSQTAMILSVSVQFIPTLLRETEMIKRAQTARGAGFDSKRLRDKAAAVMPLVIPVFLAAFRRADELSLAMEARGYHTDRKAPGRKKRKCTAADTFGLICCGCLLILQLLL